jgi:hypothetical protein
MAYPVVLPVEPCSKFVSSSNNPLVLSRWDKTTVCAPLGHTLRRTMMGRVTHQNDGCNLVTVADSGTILGLSPVTVQRIIAAGTLEVGCGYVSWNDAAANARVDDLVPSFQGMPDEAQASQFGACLSEDLLTTDLARSSSTDRSNARRLAASSVTRGRRVAEDRARSDVAQPGSADVDQVWGMLYQLQGELATIRRYARRTTSGLLVLVVMMLALLSGSLVVPPSRLSDLAAGIAASGSCGWGIPEIPPSAWSATVVPLAKAVSPTGSAPTISEAASIVRPQLLSRVSTRARLTQFRRGWLYGSQRSRRRVRVIPA